MAGRFRLQTCMHDVASLALWSRSGNSLPQLPFGWIFFTFFFLSFLSLFMCSCCCWRRSIHPSDEGIANARWHGRVKQFPPRQLTAGGSRLECRIFFSSESLRKLSYFSLKFCEIPALPGWVRKVGGKIDERSQSNFICDSDDEVFTAPASIQGVDFSPDVLAWLTRTAHAVWLICTTETRHRTKRIGIVIYLRAAPVLLQHSSTYHWFKHL